MTIENMLAHPTMIRLPEAASMALAMQAASRQGSSRTRNHSGGSTGSQGSSSSSGSSSWSDSTQYPHDLLAYHLSQQVQQHQGAAIRQHQRQSSERTTERSGQSASNNGPKNVNPTRYKTEMCRPFEESGHCKYGDKCQFAHGQNEQRNVSRHPKYKTEMCRTFHTIGFCPYGPRCHFVHNEDDLKLTEINQMKQQQVLNQVARQVAQHQILSRLALAGPAVMTREPPKPMSVVLPIPASSQIPVPRPQTLQFSSLPSSLSTSSLGSTASSVTSSSPSLSPTSMMSDDVFSAGVPSPPPGFSALSLRQSTRPNGVFNFPASSAIAPVVRTPLPTSPLNVSTGPVASLVSGLQATTLDSKPNHRCEYVRKDLPEFFAGQLTPPSSMNSLDDSLTQESPDGSRGPRLPIFSMLSTFTEIRN